MDSYRTSLVSSGVMTAFSVDAWNQTGTKEVSITVRTASGAERDDRVIKVVTIEV